LAKKKVEYIKGKDGTIGAPKVKRHVSIHAATLGWIRDHQSEYKLYAGKWAAVTPTGIFCVGDSAEDVWDGVRSRSDSPANPLVMFIHGLNEA
jgi:hypothetical protein